MLLTITATAGPGLTDATQLGYLLHKHPDRVQSQELPVGRATVFYPEASRQRCTAALLLEVDPIELVRGRLRHGGEPHALGHYVNDRPFAASSLLAVALGRVFATALKGRCDARPQLAATALPLTLRIPALPARGDADLRGADLVRALWQPLGWSVATREVDLADGLPGFDWGPAPYVDVTLTGRVRLAEALTQLYVLLPVLDGAKHYWVGPQEVDKLLRSGAGWLADHPERDLITRRYLAAQRSLIEEAGSRLAEPDDAPADAAVDAAGPGALPPAVAHAVAVSGVVPLKVQRREAVLAALRETGAARVVDLGCGEGYYLQAMLTDPAFTSILGVDVSARTLARAADRLHLGRRSERETQRLTLRQSSLTYRDDVLTGYDAMLLVEVVEHVDPDRLGSLEVNVFGHAAPRAVIVTTPNVDYNAHYGLGVGELRHPDHRFEWTRAQFEAWAREVAQRFGYAVTFRPVGTRDTDGAAPTQLALFRRSGRSVADTAATAGVGS